MCGIFGWSFKRKAKIPAGQREVLASTLAVANSLRGDQSWGAYYMSAEGRPVVRKHVGDIARVTGVGAFGHVNTLFAHTRYATTGAVIAENSHPFRAGNLLLAHNGMIFNHDALNAKYHRECAVDSMHFAHHLAAGRGFGDIEAYGTVVWVEDPHPHTVKLCRMRQGQLAVYGIKNAKGKQVGTVWSSDRAHLENALGASRLDCFPYVKLEEGAVYEVRQGKLYTVNQRLACAAPVWTGAAAAYSRTTSTSKGGACQLVRGTVETRSGSGKLTKLDAGLYVDSEGRLISTSEDDTVEDPACPTCGALAGFDENGECRECFTPSEDWGHLKRIGEMTDEEYAAWEMFQRAHVN